MREDLDRMLPSKIETLYILSAGHSGSTLLNLLIGSHSRTVAVAELTYLPANILNDERCTCGKSIRECEYWRDVGARLQSKVGIDIFDDAQCLSLGFIGAPRGVYRGKLSYRAVWRLRKFTIYLSQLTGVSLPNFTFTHLNAEARNRLAVYDCIRETSGASIVVDASKGYLPGIAIYQARPARTRLLLLIRDGRAVFHSNLTRGFGRSYSLKVWRNYYRYALPLIRRRVNHEHVLSIRYEDLATDPETKISRICSFAELEYEPSMLDTTVKQHHVTSGNSMRFRSGTDIKLDTKWCTELQDPDRAYFERHAGSLNRQLGYK
jgi:hypothetical protein